MRWMERGACADAKPQAAEEALSLCRLRLGGAVLSLHATTGNRSLRLRCRHQSRQRRRPCTTSVVGR
jgi:hypothetical protein